MADYISRETALELIDNAPIIAGNENETLISAPKLSDEVYCIPAADVRPVVRGRWEPGETVFFCGVEYAAQRTCSVCGRSALDEPWYFCPNCGADMRGDKKTGR